MTVTVTVTAMVTITVRAKATAVVTLTEAQEGPEHQQYKDQEWQQKLLDQE